MCFTLQVPFIDLRSAIIWHTFLSHCQLRVQCLAQGHAVELGDRTTDLLVIGSTSWATDTKMWTGKLAVPHITYNFRRHVKCCIYSLFLLPPSDGIILCRFKLWNPAAFVRSYKTQAMHYIALDGEYSIL